VLRDPVQHRDAVHDHEQTVALAQQFVECVDMFERAPVRGCSDSPVHDDTQWVE